MLRDGIARKAANSILIKVNQIGTLTETLETIEMAKTHGFTSIASHRSGETEDTVMCDLAVALGATYIKVGGPRRGDRIAKYNQLIRLAEQLDSVGNQIDTSPESERA